MKKNSKKIHIITPFYRQELKDIHIKNMTPYKDLIVWHPIEQYFPSKWGIDKASWIKPTTMQIHTDGWDWAYEKLNYWLQTNNIHDNDYYWFMNADCWCDAEKFFSTILCCNTDVVFVQALRGHNKPKGFEGTVLAQDITPLTVNTLSEIGLGQTDLGQIILKGSVCRHLRFPNNPFSDGMLADNIKASPHLTIKLLPNINFYFNYYQKGRWKHEN